MITPKEAEELARVTMEQYIARCKCESIEDVANALMKLVSMCGLGMCATVGQEDAVNRLQRTTDYIAQPQNADDWEKDTVQ